MTTPFQLRDYQIECLEATVARRNAGVNRQLVAIATGGGKAQPDTEPVLTPSGWTPIGTLQVGDEVFTGGGAIQHVTGVYPQGECQQFRVTFSDKTFTYCNDQHLWTVALGTHDRKRRKWETKSLADLLDSGLKYEGGNRWEIPLCKPLQFRRDEDATIAPYTMGVLLARGDLSHGVVFGCGEGDILDRVQDELPETLRIVPMPKSGHGWNSLPIWRIQGTSKGPDDNIYRIEMSARDLNVKKGDRYIPQDYLLTDIESRIALLHGYLDSRGNVHRGGHVEISSSSLQLMNDMTFLIRSLGGRVNQSINDRTRYKVKGIWKAGAPQHRCTLKLPPKIQPFLLSEKLDLYEKAVGYRLPPFRKLVDVTDTGEVVPMTCISVSGPAHTYITRDFIVTHNTEVFARLEEYHPDPYPMLVLAHREELLDQATEKIQRANPHVNIEMEKGAQRASAHADVITASVASLGRNNSPRIERFDRRHFNTVIVDEAHHAAASTYRNVLDYFDEAFRLGFTATPRRADNVRLDDVFDEIVFEKSMLALINEGYLAKPLAYRFNSAIDLSEVSIRSGDYAEGELAEVVNVPARHQLAVEAYEKCSGNTPSKMLAFCVNVQHAQDLADFFTESGYPAQAVWGAMDNREEVLSAHRRGDFLVLTNCQLATEGYDDPSIEGILMTRPTRSSIFYTQAIGRGTRLDGVSNTFWVADIADTSKGRRPLSLPSLFGMPGEFEVDGDPIDEVVKKYTALKEASPSSTLTVTSLKDIDAAWEKIDLFTPPQVNETLLEFSRFLWMEVGEEYIINVANNVKITISPNPLGTFDVTNTKDGQDRLLGTVGTLLEAFTRSDNYIKNNFADQTTLLNIDAKWRSDPPTDKQIKILKRNKVPYEHLTKGQASQIISKIFADNPRSPQQQYMIDSKKAVKWPDSL